MAKILDTNLIVRFLINDSPKQADKVERLLKNPSEVLILTDVVTAEVIYVLQSNYKFSKDQTVDKLYKLIQNSNLICHKELIFNTLFTYLNYNISFIDAYLTAYVELNRLEGIYSFDEGLDKIKSVKRFKP